ncbi:MAG: Na/Pi cotransporter family protein [Clostridia bacterium]|nr:Na/Pi cotransporter family protein [Clostridia bacterium]
MITADIINKGVECMELNYREMVFFAAGGLAFFLFGIKYMSDGLQKIAGQKMRQLLEKGTKTPLRGVISGMLVTALIQSSSGTTVLTVGLVNSGLMNLRQAIGIIMGANIGTTITAYLIGFKLEEYSLPIIAVGMAMIFFFKHKRVNTIGQILFGFGMLFFGIETMGSGLKPLKDLPIFIDAMTGIENNNLLGVLVGTVFTGIVQSSSATIGILQELSYQGAITYNQAVPILFGDNIGTTVTALLASIGTSVAARRAALTHCLFNVIGAIIFLPLFMLGIFPEIVRLFTDYIYVILPGFEGSWEVLNIKMQIAQTHGVFNISNMLIQLPFVSLLAAIVTKVIPGEDVIFEMEPIYLEPRLLANPPVALGQAGREVLRMGSIAKDAVNHAVAYFFTGLDNEAKTALNLEQIIDNLQKRITDYIVKISEHKLSLEQSNFAYIYIQAVNDIERVGDHATNIIELSQAKDEQGIRFSLEALSDMRQMIDKTMETFAWAMESLENNDLELAQKVIVNDDAIDDMEITFRRAHINRLNEGVCNGEAGAIYIDILSNLERIGDHSVNIAQYVLGER